MTRLCLRIALLMLLCPAPAGWAQPLHPRDEAKAASMAAPRISSALRRAVAEAAGPAPAWRRSGLRRLSPAPGAVLVDMHINGSAASALPALQAHGLSAAIADLRRGIVEGWTTQEHLGELAGLPAVRFMSTPLPGFTHTYGSGSVVSEGVSLLHADRLQALGITGAGVRVGVISDGVTGMASAQASRDLPASVTVLADPCVPAAAGDCAEGSAMLEIVHDVAPGATLGFCGPSTQLEMSHCVDQLADTFHADVIVDDLGFLDEPAFEDGPLAANIDTRAGNGLLYVTAAGNSHNCYYEADYSPAATTSTVYDSVHDFGSGTGYDRVVVSPGSAVVAVLQWNDPFNTSSNDYDLLAEDSAGNVLQASTDIQDGKTAPALETIQLQNNAPFNEVVNLVVARKSGAAARHFKLFMFDGSSGCQGLRIAHSTGTGDITGHPAATGAITVGAVNAFAMGSAQQPTPESFSSAGPVRIDFPALTLRAKPDIAAVDNVSVSGAGGFGYQGGTPGTCPGICFQGTSAAAPHVAAILALLKSHFTGNYVQAIESSATGPNANFLGAGLINAYAAAATMSTPPVADILAPVGDVSVDTTQAVTFTGSCSDGQSLPDTYAWSIGGVGNRSVLSPGAVTFPVAGTYTVTFHCSNAFGSKSNTVTRTITVASASPTTGGGGSSSSSGSGGGSSGGSSGGGNGGGAADLLVLLALLALGARRGSHPA
jgi:PKD repeat protein